MGMIIIPRPRGLWGFMSIECSSLLGRWGYGWAGPHLLTVFYDIFSQLPASSYRNHPRNLKVWWQEGAGRKTIPKGSFHRDSSFQMDEGRRMSIRVLPCGTGHGAWPSNLLDLLTSQGQLQEGSTAAALSGLPCLLIAPATPFKGEPPP